MKAASRGNYLSALFTALMIVLTFVQYSLGRHFPKTDPNTEPKPVHIIAQQHGVSHLWERTRVFVYQDDYKPLLAATQGRLFLIAGLNTLNTGGLIALDGADGDLVWQKSSMLSTLLADSSTVYLGQMEVGIGKVTAYEPRSGDLVWSTFLFRTKAASDLHEYSGTIYANTTNDLLYTLDKENGRIVSVERHGRIFLRTEQVDYVPSLRAIQSRDNVILWQTQLESNDVRQRPIFTDKVIYVRTERVLGQLYAIDRATGEVLWNTERIVVSNPALTQDAIYVLTRDGYLLGLDPESGATLRTVQFTPGHFILNGEAHVGGYYLAYDESIDQIYAALGDSRQLFAFTIE